MSAEGPTFLPPELLAYRQGLVGADLVEQCHKARLDAASRVRLATARRAKHLTNAYNWLGVFFLPLVLAFSLLGASALTRIRGW